MSYSAAGCHLATAQPIFDLKHHSSQSWSTSKTARSAVSCSEKTCLTNAFSWSSFTGRLPCHSEAKRLMKIKLPGGVVVEREDKRNARAQGNHKHQLSVAVSQKPSPSSSGRLCPARRLSVADIAAINKVSERSPSFGQRSATITTWRPGTGCEHLKNAKRNRLQQKIAPSIR